MKREIIITDDGSTTIYMPDLNESYHSKHGAIQEAYHVFIMNGLEEFENQPISIMEIGFGTGLNCFITYLESKKRNQFVKYTGIEAYPISSDEMDSMNYQKELNELEIDVYKIIHESEWEIPINISNTFELLKRKQFFQNIDDIELYDLIYFDAFGYRVQPELWSEDIFIRMYKSLKNNGILVTYACRTSIKKAMLNAGFKVEKLPGAPGKREMLRAKKES